MTNVRPDGRITDGSDKVHLESVHPDVRLPTVLSSIGSSVKLPLYDVHLNIARGLEPGLSVIQKFGSNHAVGSGATEDVWSGGGLYTGFLQAADTVRVQAGGNINDDSGGTGARSVTITGLDSSWMDISETIATNGVSASVSTTNQFIRVFRVNVESVGIYGGINAGDINIETTGGIVVANILADHGQTLQAIYTIPANKEGYVLRGDVNIEGNKAADIQFFQRVSADVVSAPFSPMRIGYELTQAVGYIQVEFSSYLGPFPGKTDIWVRVIGPTGGSAVSASFDITLVDV